MTTINTIEQRILAMSGGEFQKLCDAYLSKIGYGNPNSFGSVSGANNNRIKYLDNTNKMVSIKDPNSIVKFIYSK